MLKVFDEKEDYLQINEEVKNAKEPKDGILLIKKYEDLSKATNRKIINIVEKQGELLDRFKDSDEFFDSIGLSRSYIYFKIGLYKFLCKYPKLKSSTFTATDFKSNFKLIKNICKVNVDTFSKKK